MCRIFELAPHAQQLFKKFSEATVEELEENEHFRAHALQVTESVSLAVSTMDDMDELVSILKQLGAAHSPHGLQNAHYDVSYCILHYIALGSQKINSSSVVFNINGTS